MLYLLDTANIGEIEKAAAVFPLAGVTTNPTIIAQEKRDFFAILKEIRAIIGEKMLHAQVLGETCDEIIEMAGGKATAGCPLDSEAGIEIVKRLYLKAS